MINVGASVGVAIGNRAEAVDQVVADADLAVYQAKAAGKGQVEVYHAGLRHELSRRSALESDLWVALREDSLELYFQPVFEIDGGNLRFVEALLRWSRPGHGVVTPTQFLAVAEASALITEIRRWVLDRSAQQLARWQVDPALADFSMAVNVAAKHLVARSFVFDVRDALEKHGVAPGRLVIEVTEAALVADPAVAADHLDQLRRLGVQVALDDFGTGHSSFVQLRRLPIDIITIDRSYIIAGSGLGQTEWELTRVMIDLAKVLGAEVLAVGVEHQDQLDALAALGCQLVQGFLAGEPLPAGELGPWLGDRAGTAGLVGSAEASGVPGPSPAARST